MPEQLRLWVLRLVERLPRRVPVATQRLALAERVPPDSLLCCLAVRPKTKAVVARGASRDLPWRPRVQAWVLAEVSLELRCAAL